MFHDIIVIRPLAEALPQNLITRSPADRAKPPSAKAVRPPEIHPWTAEELSTFLAWADAHGRPDRVAWRLLALRSPAAKTTSRHRAGATEALRNGRRVAKMLLTRGDIHEIVCPRGDLNPHALSRALAPQASASTYSATRTCGCSSRGAHEL